MILGGKNTLFPKIRAPKNTFFSENVSNDKLKNNP